MEPSPDLDAAIAEGLRVRDRANMAPTIQYFTELLAAHPGEPAVLLELAGSYDTDGQEETAEKYYLMAFEAGLSGDRRRRALLQYGSTLRNLGRLDESLKTLEDAKAEFPTSDSLRVFYALSLHAAGRANDALAETLLVIAECGSPEIQRYDAAIRGNADYLRGL